MAEVNRQITLAARPVGFPKESDFNLVESPIPTPGDHEFLVRVIYVSVDPYMRGRMNDSRSSYIAPFQIGGVIESGAVGQVMRSNHPDFREGDYVEGFFGWQEYAVSNGKGVRKLDPNLAPISTALGVLGMPGMTAYFGLLDICHPQPGETVVVSGAAGAVGMLVGQIAKIKGCYVVGIAGTDEKVNYLINELGFDAAYNYKTVTNHVAKLRELCPKGIDVYFDNVGGEITDAVFMLINTRARISLCGQISQYNVEKPEMGPRLLFALVVKQAKAEGFLVFQFADRYPEGIAQMAQWIKEGKLKYAEDIAEGIENTPRAFIGMLKGQNLGKQLVKYSHE
ncbi:MAG TPA: NADP-dependent oxidoreductase [Blastocatellia bacterium]|nr:NADP-dependent oxidoreductase [Blastocatellia bacterium]